MTIPSTITKITLSLITIFTTANIYSQAIAVHSSEIKDNSYLFKIDRNAGIWWEQRDWTKLSGNPHVQGLPWVDQGTGQPYAETWFSVSNSDQEKAGNTTELVYQFDFSDAKVLVTGFSFEAVVRLGSLPSGSLKNYYSLDGTDWIAIQESDMNLSAANVQLNEGKIQIKSSSVVYYKVVLTRDQDGENWQGLRWAWSVEGYDPSTKLQALTLKEGEGFAIKFDTKPIGDPKTK